MIEEATTDPQLIAFYQLVIMAFFFAMRSCEYLKVSGKPRRTKPLCMRNFQFTSNHKVIPLDSPNLADADCVTITFEYQKSDKRDEQVTQQRTDHSLLCPVKACATIIKRLRAQGDNKDTPVYAFVATNGTKAHVTAKVGLQRLREFIGSIDNEGEGWGLLPLQIGLHSLRSSSAMAMKLNNIPIPTIMLIGRWSSNAFMRYIRMQVEQFSRNVSKAMIRNTAYHHVADPTPDENPFEREDRGPDDAPRTIYTVWR